MDTYLLKIHGKAELPQPIEIGHNFRVSSEGSVISSIKSDNEDGSFTHTYVFKPIKIEVLTPLGETLKLSDTRTLSQQFRAMMWKIWKAQGDAESFEDVVYPRLMKNLIEVAADVYEMYSK